MNLVSPQKGILPGITCTCEGSAGISVNEKAMSAHGPVLVCSPWRRDGACMNRPNDQLQGVVSVKSCLNATALIQDYKPPPLPLPLIAPDTCSLLDQGLQMPSQHLVVIESFHTLGLMNLWECKPQLEVVLALGTFNCCLYLPVVLQICEYGSISLSYVKR